MSSLILPLILFQMVSNDICIACKVLIFLSSFRRLVIYLCLLVCCCELTHAVYSLYVILSGFYLCFDVVLIFRWYVVLTITS
jgi:hypothetical protein